ncbi:MAG: tetratricopeptide repeat protein [Verrucomicrobia bacterium]|nr:tetratricopeptide repeat protein [Verrucomicrobiota bacterium]
MKRHSTDHQIRTHQVGMLLLAALCLLWPSFATAAADPFEPSVTRQEAELLEQAMTLAEKDVTAAITQLQTENRVAASPALDYALGNLYVQTNRLTDAEAAYREALRKLPRFRAARNNLARLYLMQERPAAAISAFAELVRDGQGDAETFLLYGHACTLENRLLSAETAYRQALLLQPDGVEARRGLARCLIDQQRYAESSPLVSELLSLAPDDAELWSLQANIHLTQERPTDAVASLETARRLQAVTPDMLATLGDLYLNLAQPADAVAAYTQAFAITNAPVTRQLRAAEGLIQIGEWQAAENLLDQLDARMQRGRHVLTSAEDQQRTRLRADAAYRAGRPDEARTALRELLQRDPLDGAALLTLGDLDRESGRLEEARLSYERAARIRGFEARALVRQAQVEVDRERYAAAVELLQAAQAFEDQPHVARYLDQVRRLVR